MPSLRPFFHSQLYCSKIVESGQSLYLEQRKGHASSFNLKKWPTADEFTYLGRASCYDTLTSLTA